MPREEVGRRVSGGAARQAYLSRWEVNQQDDPWSHFTTARDPLKAIWDSLESIFEVLESAGRMLESTLCALYEVSGIRLDHDDGAGEGEAGQLQYAAEESNLAGEAIEGATLW